MVSQEVVPDDATRLFSPTLKMWISRNSDQTRVQDMSIDIHCDERTLLSVITSESWELWLLLSRLRYKTYLKKRALLLTMSSILHLRPIYAWFKSELTRSNRKKKENLILYAPGLTFWFSPQKIATPTLISPCSYHAGNPLLKRDWISSGESSELNAWQ